MLYYLYKLENKASNETVKISDYRHYVVERCMGDGKYIINPEKVNMGMWLFASQIVGNHYELSKIFKENDENKVINGMKNAIEEYINREKKEIQELSRII